MISIALWVLVLKNNIFGKNRSQNRSADLPQLLPQHLWRILIADRLDFYTIRRDLLMS